MNRAFSPESFRGCPRLKDECCGFGVKQTGAPCSIVVDRFDTTIVGQQLEEVTE